MRYASASLLVLAACAAAEERVHSTSSADQADPDGTVVVTADRQATSLDSTTATISVVGADEDRRDGHPLSWTERLRRTPGVDLLNSNGGMDSGGFPGLRLRGTESDSDTQVLVDGIPWNDPTGTEGQPSLLALQPSGVQRIEVVRGAQSGLYGSQAVGGVVNLIGDRPTEVQHGRMRLEAGSFHTLSADAALTGPLLGGAHGLGFAAGVSAVDSDGFSSQTTASDGDPGGAEDDGLRRLGGNARIEGSPLSGLALYLAGWAGSADHEFDQAGPDDDAAEKDERLRRGAGGGVWQLPFLGSALAFDAAYTSSERDVAGSAYESGEWYWSTRWTVPVLPWLAVTPGVDATHQRADAESGGVAVYEDTLAKGIGAWLQALAHHGDWDASLVVRRDQRTGAGDATTWRAGLAWMPEGGTLRLHAAMGTAFRAPSIEEQYAFYDFGPYGTYHGNPDLEAQRSASWEAGVEGDPAEGLHLAATAFGTRYENRIVYVAGFPDSTLENEDSSSRILGVEGEGSWAVPGTAASLFATGTWQDTEDQDGHRFVAIPTRKGSIGITRDQEGGWATVAVDGVGSRRNANGGPELPGYGTLSVVLGWRARTWLSLYARGENLLDHHHSDGVTFTPGTWYTSAPRSLFLGAEAAF